ncbi:MAG: protein-L-isoaspartate(D-aspartate) O-methyltransferase [Gammaproteobacteria bacterium]|nr:protein-L-isoaspartate(D-aspartate) O-methyltransferase [Gammaproteobacteria bacterium]
MVNRHIHGIGMTSQRTRSRLVERLRQEGIHNEAVLAVVRDVPRHLFVDEALASRAYEDTALPIGHGQTISQPYIVARMTEVLLESGPLDKVLEIGTGSGYQAAVMAALAGTVFSVERIKPLLDQARQRFRELGFKNIRLKLDDGHPGWPANGPYDAIIATAAPEKVPADLLVQLADGGRMVIPIGPQGRQMLTLIQRNGDEFLQQPLEAVSFVPMIYGGR